VTKTGNGFPQRPAQIPQRSDAKHVCFAEIAIAPLVVILLGGMYGLIRWGGPGRMDRPAPAILHSRTNPDDQGSLAMAGEQFRVEGDRILIRATDRRSN
jgi:hypothetical protein